MDKKITDITDPSIIVSADNCKDIYFSLFNSMYDGLSVFEVCGNKIRALYLNERYFDNVGYTLEQYTPYIENVTVTLFEEDEQRIFGLAQDCIRNHSDFYCEVRGYRYDGSVGWFCIRARTVNFIKSDNPVFLASINDISRRKELEHKYNISKERYRILEETSSAFLFEYSLLNDNMTFFPKAGKSHEIVNYGMYLRRSNRIYPDDAIYFYYILMRCCRKECKGFIDIRYLDNVTEEYIHSRVHYSSIADEFGFVLKIVGRIEDITEQNGIKADLIAEKYNAQYGTLPAAGDAIAQISEKISHEGTKGALLFADIDDFGDFNSRYGKEAADNAVALAAEIVGDVFSDSVVFKFPDDEFVIYTENMSEPDLHDRYEKLQAACRTIKLTSGNTVSDIGITFSVGAAWTHNSSKVNMKDYFITAERVLYKTKTDGKNRMYVEKIIF